MMKSRLKRIPFLFQTNAFIKTRLQERKAATELAYYHAEAKKRSLKVLKGSELSAALRRRLAARGVYPVPKPKGDLHI